jgi:hypothetical protein
MARLFAVLRSIGPAWNEKLSLEQQDDWDGHAAVMTALHDQGFVVLGGPLEVLLIVRANDPEEIRPPLARDSWTEKGLLHIKQIVLWTLRLGSLL